MEKILVVDDELGILELCKTVLKREGYEVVVTSHPREVATIVSNENIDLAIIDMKMPGMDGIQLLKIVKAASPQTEAIMFSGQATAESAIESLKLGAYDYILKPFNLNDFLVSVKKCLEYKRLRINENTFRETTYLYQLANEITKSQTEKQLLEFILERGVKTANADAGSIFMLMSEGEALAPMAFYGAPENCVTDVKIGEGVAGWVAKNRQSLLIQDGLSNVPALQSNSARHEIVSSMVVPLINQEVLIGVLCINRFVSRTNYQFTPHDLESLEIFALHATLIITGLRYHQSIVELDQMKSDFVANVSHELRTPLMAISGAIELLTGYAEKMVKDEKVNLFLGLITRNTERMRTLLNDLLDFSRLESNQLKLSPTKYMLDVQLAETIQDLEMKAREKAITLKYREPAEHIEAYADHERIKQVAANLISNAIKFTPEGGLITVECGCDGKIVEFSVKDNGVGIPLDKQTKIFEKFFQVDTSASRSHGGFGIGLSICKSVVEKHGGKISVLSEPGQGSTFTVKLPVQTNSAVCADERGK